MNQKETTMSENSIQLRIADIQRNIENVCIKVGRNPDEVRLIAVSKTKPIADVEMALVAGQKDFGENKMQELHMKMAEIDNDSAIWHMIGTIQTNKIRQIAEHVHWIHSVSKLKYLKEIDKRAAQFNRIINVLIQVNISGEDQKSGCEISELASILEEAKSMKHIMVRGLMGMASFTEDRDKIRSEFKSLKTALDDHLHLNGPNTSLTELSMGMSGDFDIAIEEGSTMIRIGSSIFGARNYT